MGGTFTRKNAEIIKPLDKQGMNICYLVNIKPKGQYIMKEISEIII